MWTAAPLGCSCCLKWPIAHLQVQSPPTCVCHPFMSHTSFSMSNDNIDTPFSPVALAYISKKERDMIPYACSVRSFALSGCPYRLVAHMCFSCMYNAWRTLDCKFNMCRKTRWYTLTSISDVMGMLQSLEGS